MIRKRPTIRLIAMGDRERFQSLRIANSGVWTLSELLHQAPALSPEVIDPAHMARRLEELNIVVLNEVLHVPPGLVVSSRDENGSAHGEPANTEAAANLQPEGDRIGGNRSGGTVKERRGAVDPSAGQTAAKPEPVVSFPTNIEEKDAVIQSYSRDIDKAASFLRAGLPVLVYCDKLVVGHLWRETLKRSNLEHQVLELPDGEESSMIPRSMRQRQLARLKEMIRNLKMGQVLVVPHLDLLAGGSDSNLPTESRELIELAYEAGDRLVLAFADRSLEIPEVLAARFAVRLLISGVSRTVVTSQGERRIGEALVTAAEAASFSDYEPEGLYKNVAGMNPIRLRHAIRYAVEEYAGPEPVPVAKLYEAIRAFKAQTSAKFEVPNVSFDEIGGYEDVKKELLQAIHLMLGVYTVDPKLRSELIPRGFIFYGPAGTGKTLFAKAVANKMNATIQVVSGPEVTDKYVGESERKVRELFAEARRNAPSVLVFDEFDSIAGRRSGHDDGGSRAGNALVAQILTEMDGFRPDVPLLVIGTTNRLDVMDDALLRPSRFKAVKIGLPNQPARRAIAKVHARHFQVDVPPDLLDVLADSTEWMNGDEIRSIFRDACVAEKLHGVMPDARALGRLVGQLRLGAQQREAAASSRQTSPPSFTRRDEPPAPTGPTMPLTRARSIAPASPPGTASVPHTNIVIEVDSTGGVA